MQIFERRVLTYTAANTPSFQVEMGNVGQHYYQWRYPPNAPPIEPPLYRVQGSRKGMSGWPRASVETSPSRGGIYG